MIFGFGCFRRETADKFLEFIINPESFGQTVENLFFDN